MTTKPTVFLDHLPRVAPVPGSHYHCPRGHEKSQPIHTEAGVFCGICSHWHGWQTLCTPCADDTDCEAT